MVTKEAVYIDMARNTEWVRLEGATVALLGNLPAQGQDRQDTAIPAIPIHGKLCSTFQTHRDFVSDSIAVLYKKKTK